MKSESTAATGVIEPLPVSLAPRLAVLGAVLLWGASFSTMRIALHDLHPWSVMWLRMVIALACSSAIGIIFGFIPARNAAQLNPIDALARE